MYYVYILKCSDASYYAGVTNNLERRVCEHNEGIDRFCYTFSRRPVTLIYFEELSRPRDAITREKQIKGWTRKKKESLIANQFKELRTLSKRKKK